MALVDRTRYKDLQSVIRWRGLPKRYINQKYTNLRVNLSLTVAETDILHRLMIHARKDIMEMPKESSSVRLFWALWRKVLEARLKHHKKQWNTAKETNE